MRNIILPCITRRAILPFAVFSLTIVAFPQGRDKPEPAGHFGGAVTITTNGISFIPNFTLGRPAAIFDLTAGKRNLSFEPQFRFALDGKPWAILFWWRYRILNNERFQISIGAHPSLSFKTITIPGDTLAKEYLVTNRYLAGELAPYYLLTKNISLGIYYFYGHGIDKEAVKYTHMVALRTSVFNVRLAKEIYLRFNPQVYYLRMEEKDGSYFSASLALTRTNFPLSVSALINTPIRTNILAGNKFIWNASLIYTFNKEYVKK